ncbi:restriction endonuclease subunit R, partial [Nostoc sp. 'Peltigera malacea cyanobiont' DB3992]
EEMVYVKGMTQLVGNLLRSPSEKFIHFLVSELRASDSKYEFSGNINTKVVNKFNPIIKKSIQGSLLDLMTSSLSREMSQPVKVEVEPEIEEEEQPQDPQESRILTTAEEIAAFEKIKAITQTSKSYSFELKYRDTTSYFGINLGKTTWWFLRLYLSSQKKSFIVRLSVDEVKSLASKFEVQEVSASLGDAASKVIISSVSDLDKLTSLILRCYEAEAAKHQTLTQDLIKIEKSA